MLKRCKWVGNDPLYIEYHDKEWGVPVHTDPGIIRNKLKIQSAVTNAQAFLKIQDKFGSFDAYSWQFVGGKCKVNKLKTMKEIPATSKESDALSKDLKKRGFKFVGSTIIYAHMQAVGMVNDHTTDCFRYKELEGE